ncbi:MAG: UDP-N-acetylmuramate--L-alanine ligase [Planctomycetia bacterium]|nr:UDP-N-acetylmuramate--L-alanine ligase [Planctomycetia bacterium]
MQALAAVLLARGWRLTGSDVDPGAADWLAGRDVTVHAGHDARHIDARADLVMHSDAVGEDNVERRRAARLGIAQSSYPQAVAGLMAHKRGIAVAGTHGKSTTTAMIGAIMVAAGVDPTVIGGAAPLDGGPCGGRAGRGPWLVAEACEYRANFLRLRPEIAVILNIEPDHFDCYPTPRALERAFVRFMSQAGRNGTGRTVVANLDCPATRRCLAAAGCRAMTFGLAADACWRPAHVEETGGLHRFTVLQAGRKFCEIRLRVPGRHQVSNALAAVAAAQEAGIAAGAIERGLSEFAGIHRRLERVASLGGVEILDDYAHHPTEVRATLAAVRLMYPNRRVWCLFQPHQVSRTRALVDDFASSLQNADRVAVADVFAAREVAGAAPRAVAEDLAARARRLGGTVLPGHQLQTIVGDVAAAARPGDVVLTMGAGDIRKHLP